MILHQLPRTSAGHRLVDGGKVRLNLAKKKEEKLFLVLCLSAQGEA